MQGLLLLQEKFVLAKFAITILPECYYQKHFLSLHCPKGQDILDESVSLLALYRNLENVILLVFILLYTNKIAVIAPCKRNRIETKSVF